jgi:tetratricopeptide (TPR) repeat protein
MQKAIWALTVSLLVSFYSPSMVQSDNDDTDTDVQENQNTVEEYHPITSIDAQMIGKPNSRALASSAEYCVHTQQYDRAIKLSQLALDENNDDNEIHQVYAEALEGKLVAQTDRDPVLFNQCVKEWLIVLRQEYGDEKLTYHGLGIPGLGKFYEDDDRVIPARSHLMKLVGFTPKVWETDDKYLKRASAAGNSKVYGKLMQPEKQNARSD